jgi:hypothetical protein
VPAAPAGEAEETGFLFSCTWKDGSDEENTGGGAGHVWTTESDTGDTLTKDTGGNGWNGETNCLKYDDSDGTPVANLLLTLADTKANLGFRFSLDWVLDGMSDTQTSALVLLVDDSSIERMQIHLYHDGTASSLRLSCHNGFSLTVIGSVDVDTYLGTGEHLQIVGDWEASTACKMKVYREDGVTAVGAEVVNGGTFSAAGIKGVYLGHVLDDSRNNDWYIDIVAIKDTAGYPVTRVP